MTTVVRHLDVIYTDSCYGAPAGTERTRIFGEPKFFLNANKTFLAAICGSIPDHETCKFLTTDFTKPLEQYLGNYLNQSPRRLTDYIESFYEQYCKVKPKLNEVFTIIFFTKALTLQINVRAAKDKCVARAIVYQQHKDLAFGSGAAWWISQKGMVDQTVLDKFTRIYALDINSGGTVNAFDLNQLKEIKL